MKTKHKKLEKRYAMIINPKYGLIDRDFLALQFELSYENGMGSVWYLRKEQEIKQLFTSTGTSKIKDLDGIVVETYTKDGTLRGISVNSNLVRTALRR